jgi:N-acetylmuramoyl-L-alanine amidase
MLLAAVAAATAATAATAPLDAQTGPQLLVEPERGSPARVSLSMDRGYAAVPASLLTQLGWAGSFEEASASFVAPSGATIELRSATPYFYLNGELRQLSHAPFGRGGELHVPLQLFSDVLPRHFPELYAFDGPTLTLRAGPAPAPAAVSPPSPAGEAEAPEAAPSPYAGVRVVVIDPGHGGVDPGAIGVGGVREKNVALSISLALAEVLREEPNLEVHLLRDDDSFIELWDRGQMATDLRGERPGVFISIHANSFPNRGNARGFETYFLSEARTDHERRVAAIENAPISVGGDDAPATEDLDFILRELRNLDHQHWSALLAGNIQEEVERVHPGPNRGVKQAPLAVITNALMPSVLVEIGYLSDAREARLLARESFHEDAAGAIGRAVVRFFERYPPGSGGGEGRR